MGKNRAHKPKTKVAKSASTQSRVEELIRKAVVHLHNPETHKRPVDQYELTDTVEEKLGPCFKRMLQKKQPISDHDVAVLVEAYVLSYSYSDPLRIKGTKTTTYYSSGSSWQPKWQKKDELQAEADDQPFTAPKPSPVSASAGVAVLAGTVSVDSDTPSEAEKNEAIAAAGGEVGEV